MLISVLIPTYNRAEMLKKCIESVQRQTYNNIEIVVSDNASTDKTETSVKKLQREDSKIRYYKNPKNIGMTDNIKKLVFNYANGEYAIILSDDDELYDDTYLEKVVTLVNKYNNEKVSFCFANCINDYCDLGVKNLHTKAKFPEIFPKHEYFLKHKKFSKATHYLSAPLCTTVFNVTIFKEIKAFDGGDGLLSFDLLAWLKMSLVGRVLYIDTIASLYRVYSKNTCNSSGLGAWISNLKYIDEAASFASMYMPEKVVNDWYKDNKRQYIKSISGRLFKCEKRVDAIQGFYSLIKIEPCFPNLFYIFKLLTYFISPMFFQYLQERRHKLY